MPEPSPYDNLFYTGKQFEIEVFGHKVMIKELDPEEYSAVLDQAMDGIKLDRTKYVKTLIQATMVAPVELKERLAKAKMNAGAMTSFANAIEEELKLNEANQKKLQEMLNEAAG